MIDPEQITALLARIPTGTTPGPWRFNEPLSRHKGHVVVEEIAVYCGGYDGHGAPNAELIALAPELRDAVVAMADEIEALRGELATVKAESEIQRQLFDVAESEKQLAQWRADLDELTACKADNSALRKRVAHLESVQRDYDRVTNALPWPAKKHVVDAHVLAFNNASPEELTAHLADLSRPGYRPVGEFKP